MDEDQVPATDHQARAAITPLGDKTNKGLACLVCDPLQKQRTKGRARNSHAIPGPAMQLASTRVACSEFHHLAVLDSERTT